MGLLHLEKVKAGYDDIPVLFEIDVEVNSGEVVALVGSNGAGKTTLLKCISGLIKPLAGKILFSSNDITNAETYKRVFNGIAHVPEGRQLFNGMTVRENILIGAYLINDKMWVKEKFDFVLDFFPELVKRLDQQAGNLSGGEQQMVAIAKGLMSNPKLLIIDELSLGLAPMVVEKLFELIKKLHDETNLTILFVDQDVRTSLEVSNRCYVMENGEIVKTGVSAELINDDNINKFILGI